MAKFGIDEVVVDDLKQCVPHDLVDDEKSLAKCDDEGWKDVPKDWDLCSPPSDLWSGDVVEVMFRNGDTDISLAESFHVCWKQESSVYDIIKYRHV